MPIVTFRISQTIRLVTNTNAPIATMPINCVTMEPDPKMPTARVPQIPQTRCAEIAPTTSSMRSLSISGTAMTTRAPPIPPISIA